MIKFLGHSLIKDKPPIVGWYPPAHLCPVYILKNNHEGIPTELIAVYDENSYFKSYAGSMWYVFGRVTGLSKFGSRIKKNWWLYLIIAALIIYNLVK